MNLIDLNEKSTVSRNNGFIFNEIVKLTKKMYSSLSNINIHYLKHRIPIIHRHL